MNFDKFKDMTPSRDVKASVLSCVNESNADYISSMSKLKLKQKPRIAVIVMETAAAVVLLLAIMLWALIGRGVRNMDPVPSGAHGGDVPVYKTLYDFYNGKAVYGGDDLQAFFDDYVNGKPCTLRLFKSSDAPSDGRYFGYTELFEVNADGSGTVYYITDGDSGYADAYHGIYCFAFPSVDFESIRFFFSGEREKCYMSIGDTGYIDFNIADIKNSYDNCDAVFDTRKADSVSTVNGKVLQGEESLKRFFENYSLGHYAEVTVNEETVTARNFLGEEIIALKDGNMVQYYTSSEIFLFELDETEITRLGIPEFEQKIDKYKVVFNEKKDLEQMIVNCS